MSEHELTELRRVNPVSTDEVAPFVTAHRGALVAAMGSARGADPPDRRHRGDRPLVLVPTTATDANRPRQRIYLLWAAAAAIVLAVPAVVFIMATGSDRDMVDTPISDVPADDEQPAADELPAADQDEDLSEETNREVFSPSPVSTPDTTTTAPASTNSRPGVGQTPGVETESAVPAAETDRIADQTTDVGSGPEPGLPPATAATTAAPSTTPAATAPPPTAPVTSSATTTAPSGDAAPIAARTTALPFDPSVDLLVVTLDFGHRDDAHATVATRELATRFDLDPLVIAGTRMDDQAFVHDYAEIMTAAWGSGWIDGADRDAAVNSTADRWLATIDAGGVVRVAEGGVSDFTADVLRELRLRRPTLDTTSRITVVHHSVRNEEETRAGDLDLIRANTTAIRIDDGNNANDTADLNGSSTSFEAAALAGDHRDAWLAAFDFYEASSLDFSDTVTVLHVLGIGVDQVSNADDFASLVIAG